MIKNILPGCSGLHAAGEGGGPGRDERQGQDPRRGGRGPGSQGAPCGLTQPKDIMITCNQCKKLLYIQSDDNKFRN